MAAVDASCFIHERWEDAMATSGNRVWEGEVPLAATAVVKRIEGFYSEPYDDNGSLPGGTWTIGYGSIVDGAGKRVTVATPPITEDQGVTLLQRDMASAAADVKRRVQVELSQCQAAALISWTYNLGVGNLAKSTMLQRLNAGDYLAVPDEMRKWINHEGRPLVGLLRRRWAEAAIYSGMDPTAACVLAWKNIDDLRDWPAFVA
jgi:lysozyme